MSPTSALYAIGFLVYLAIGSVTPLVPEFQQNLQASIADVSVVVAAFGLARVCVDVPVAQLGIRFGTRPLLAAGTAGLVLAYGGSAIATGIPGLLLGQLVAGIGSALCHVTSLAALGAGSSPDRSGRIMGRYFLATFGGLAVAGPLSGYIAARAGWRASLVAASTLAALALALVGLALPRPRVPLAPLASARAADWRRVLEPRLWTIYLLHGTALFLWAGVRGMLWPTLASGDGRLSVDTIGIALGVGSLLSLGALYVAGAAGDRYGKRPVIGVGLGAAATGVALLGGARTRGILLASLALHDVGQGFMAANASALLADALPGPSLGLATGVMRLTADVGWLLGPLALGGVAASLGTGATVVAAAAVPLTNLLLLAARGPGGIPPGGPGAAAMRS
jgi:MFS family permease